KITADELLAVCRRDRYRNRRSAFKRKGRGAKRLQASKPGCGKVAGDAAHAEAIGPVGGDGDVDQGVVKPKRACHARSDGGFPKLDNARRIAGNAEFFKRAEHTV